MAPITDATSTSGYVSTPISAATGIIAAETAEKTSEPTLVRCRPSRSMITPLASDATSIGTAPAATTMPAAAGSLVSCSVSHGSAIEATPLPVPAISVAASRARKGCNVAA